MEISDTEIYDVRDMIALNKGLPISIKSEIIGIDDFESFLCPYKVHGHRPVLEVFIEVITKLRRG